MKLSPQYHPCMPGIVSSDFVNASSSLLLAHPFQKFLKSAPDIAHKECRWPLVI